MAQNLIGKWENELHSHICITDTTNGVIQGKYKTIVGDDHEEEDVIGFWKYIEERNATLLSFTVMWKHMENNKPSSVTAWTGECIENIIKTTWILTSSEKPDNKWKNTVIGKDIFTKIEKKKT